MKLESANDELSRELHIYRSKRATLDYCNMNTQVIAVCIRELRLDLSGSFLKRVVHLIISQEDGVSSTKDDCLKRGFESIDSDYEMSDATSGLEHRLLWIFFSMK